MKSLLLWIVFGAYLSGCSVAASGVLGIPATEYMVRTDNTNEDVTIPIAGGLVALHGGATYLMWFASPPIAIGYLSFSAVYSFIRIIVKIRD